MALMVCRRCTTKFAVGLSRCPHCTYDRADLEGTEDMGKSTVLGGTTATDPTTDVTYRVNDDGSRGDPIHPVDDADQTTATAATESTSTTSAPSTKAPAKKAAPAKASTK